MIALISATIGTVRARAEIRVPTFRPVCNVVSQPQPNRPTRKKGVEGVFADVRAAYLKTK
jgi:hypothetical protein